MSYFMKRLLWRATSKMIWWQSEAMRHDYETGKAKASAAKVVFPAFPEWLGFRIFGDERGYRFTVYEYPEHGDE